MEARKNNLFNSLSRAIRRRLSSSSRSEELGPAGGGGGGDVVGAAANPGNLPPEAVELMQFHASLAVLQDQNIYVDFSNTLSRVANERQALAKYGYYYGPISVQAAQRKLNGKRNGSFLVRDSHTGPFFFSISFRSGGCTLHTRIEFVGGFFTIFAGRRYKSVRDLIDDTMREEGILCYVPSSSKLGPDFPIQLKFPVSRFVETSLQHQCRLLIRGRLDQTGGRMEALPLPKLLVEYLSETTFDVL